MFNTLSYIAEKLNAGKVLWGVGASILLNHYGLIDKPNDIDILIDLNDIEKADTILKSIGEKKVCEKSDTYSTKYFYEYVVNGVDIDVMAGLSINHNEGIYRYSFDDNSILQNTKINGINIPLTSLEDWYVLYQVIPNRENKVNMIENYLLSNGIKQPNLLEKALKGNLPNIVRNNIERLLIR
ncbi:nucleotidyltransferase family protein [Tepidibacter sp. Z1-5]|uniref:nucleotidyltransferase family protein n=1 Tax=Tepidibacter sp. Z1-5 TaxID=3134138 RepID=UPI0030BC1264